jgi:hypothetical protein
MVTPRNFLVWAPLQYIHEYSTQHKVTTPWRHLALKVEQETSYSGYLNGLLTHTPVEALRAPPAVFPTRLGLLF